MPVRWRAPPVPGPGTGSSDRPDGDVLVEFVVVQPERRRGSKSDRIDADELSERIRSGRLGRTIVKDRGRFIELREFARTGIQPIRRS